MKNKKLKVITIITLIMSFITNISFALDKEELMRLFIQSSYPEVQSEENEKIEDNKNSDSEEYIKIHVGKENIPDIPVAQISKEESTANYNQYKDNIRITGDKPKILIYHTHGGETYSNSPDGNYHSQDKENSVIEVGRILTNELEKKGWEVVHNTNYNDLDFNSSYTKSLEMLKNMLTQYDSVELAIDLHRDGRTLENNSDKKAEHERMSTTYKGESVAKFFFVVGTGNPNVNKVKSLASGITEYTKQKYPEMIRDVVVKENKKFNQYAAPNHMLVEVGSNGTDINEAKASAKYLANTLDGYLKKIDL